MSPDCAALNRRLWLLRRRCRELGADVVHDWRDAAALPKLYGHEPFDVVFDVVGGELGPAQTGCSVASVLHGEYVQLASMYSWRCPLQCFSNAAGAPLPTGCSVRARGMACICMRGALLLGSLRLEAKASESLSRSQSSAPLCASLQAASLGTAWPTSSAAAAWCTCWSARQMPPTCCGCECGITR